MDLKRKKEILEREIGEYKFLSTGISPGCDECPEYDEGYFSYTSCDLCGDT